MLGQTIKAQRTRAGLSLRTLAQRIGCDHSAIARWERGENTPSAYYCLRLEAVFGLRVGTLARHILRPARGEGARHVTRQSRRVRIGRAH